MACDFAFRVMGMRAGRLAGEPRMSGAREARGLGSSVERNGRLMSFHKVYTV